MTDEQRPQCDGIRKDGQRCTMRVLVDGRHCMAHAPSLAAKRAEAQRRGGRNRSNAVRLRGLVPPRLSPVFDQLEGALGDVLAGTLPPQQATAAAAVARAMVAVLTSGELEERVRQLEGGSERGRR